MGAPQQARVRQAIRHLETAARAMEFASHELEVVNQAGVGAVRSVAEAVDRHTSKVRRQRRRLERLVDSSYDAAWRQEGGRS